MKITKKAFTLVELLVVIAIIGILASMVLVSLGTSRKKANDSKVSVDVNQIMTLLAEYYADNGGTYQNVADISALVPSPAPAGLSGDRCIDGPGSPNPFPCTLLQNDPNSTKAKIGQLAQDIRNSFAAGRTSDRGIQIGSTPGSAMVIAPIPSSNGGGSVKYMCFDSKGNSKPLISSYLDYTNVWYANISSNGCPNGIHTTGTNAANCLANFAGHIDDSVHGPKAFEKCSALTTQPSLDAFTGPSGPGLIPNMAARDCDCNNIP